MKQKFFSLLMAIIFGIGIPIYTRADNVTLGIILMEDQTSEQDDSSEEPELPLLPPGKGRCPAAPLLCSISREGGIQISGIDTAEIVSFEIIDAYGNTIAILQDEPSFIETIFSLNGEYRIVFRFNNRTLAGWIEI